MGLFDLFLSPEKQIEKERKLLEKPNRTVAVVTGYRDWETTEDVTDGEGETSYETVYMQSADFKFMADGELREFSTSPRQGKNDFSVGEQWIVKLDGKKSGIVDFEKRLRDDSPNRLSID